ncbi:MAG: ABC-F family ATP-binding cassette domain-containing protein [Treponema sp.]
MPFVQLSKICLAFGDRDILSDITLVLTAGTKAALTGANGCGKSTLMKIIAGAGKADSGSISAEKNTRLAYLPQSGIVHSGKTLIEETETAFVYGAEILNRLELLGKQMEHEADSGKAERLAHEYHDLQTALEQSGWYARKGLMDETLRGLGFTQTDFSRAVDEFSGGWQMRIALAKILLSGADILILDEPTNYLDIEARNWLQLWLKKFAGGFLLVSHDRSFLDAAVTETYELFAGQLKRYSGSYTQYEKTRAAELESLIKAYSQQQDEIAKTEDFIRKFRYNKSKAALVQDRIRRLEKMERLTLPEHLKKIHFSFPPAPHSGEIVIQAEHIHKQYGNRVILHEAELLLSKKERLVLCGRNGAGKTTLLRILAGEDSQYTGSIRYGAGVSAGYFSQDEAERITGSESIISVLEKEAPTELIPKLHDMLAAFLFRGDDIHKPLSVLSGGEKSRLALLRLLLRPLNVLILDEPTNHLDLHSKDVLLDALQRFEGTVIFVSHDKFFIQGLATRVFELTASASGDTAVPSRIRNFPGSYDYYLYRIAQETESAQSGGVPLQGEQKSRALRNEQRRSEQHPSQVHTHTVQGKSAQQPPQKLAVPNCACFETAPDAPLSYEAQKKLRAEKRKREKEEERLMNAVSDTESRIAAVEHEMTLPENYADGEKIRCLQQELESLKLQAEQLTAEWEALAASE